MTRWLIELPYRLVTFDMNLSTSHCRLYFCYDYQVLFYSPLGISGLISEIDKVLREIKFRGGSAIPRGIKPQLPIAPTCSSNSSSRPRRHEDEINSGTRTYVRKSSLVAARIYIALLTHREACAIIYIRLCIHARWHNSPRSCIIALDCIASLKSRTATFDRRQYGVSYDICYRQTALNYICVFAINWS